MSNGLLLFLTTAAAVAVATLGHPQPHTNDIYDDRWMHTTVVRRTRRVVKRDVTGSLDENSAEYWNEAAQRQLTEKLSRQLNTNIAKNVIFFIGDGMSIPTYAASRIYKGQLENKTGESETLTFEHFPFVGLSRTYCLDNQVPDSACSATAYLCGVKANTATIGVTGDVLLSDCPASADENNQVTSIARWSQLRGKRTGFATTTRVTHASPAGVYAHTSHRDWESDTDLINGGGDTQVCSDIAKQLIYGETGKNLNVILGGGRRKLLPKNLTDSSGNVGDRSDGENLIQSWLDLKAARKARAQYVYDRSSLLKVSPKTDYLLGLFSQDHLPYHLDADDQTPTLADMTEAAIKVLDGGRRGFFLFVEGGRIDHAHHATLAKKSLDETVELSKAVQRALEITDERETLIVVSSDHAHTMSFAGYPVRGNDILGTAGTGTDGLLYPTLSYANGPGYRPEENGTRHDLSKDDMHANNYLFPAAVPLGSETHGGDDVGIFAIGPWAHLFTGSNEENFIPHGLAYASCVGEGITACGRTL